MHPLIIAMLLAAGGTAKTTSTVILGTLLALRGYYVRIFDLDAQCNSSETLCVGPNDRPEEARTIWDLIQNKASLEDVSTPALYFEGTDEEGDYFTEVPNLSVIPGDPELKHADVTMAVRNELFTWLVNLCDEYANGVLTAHENEVWLFDLPANYGRLTVSAMTALEENDEVIPPLLVTGKEHAALDKLFVELREMSDKYRGRSAPARPTVHNVLLCATPTSKHDAAEYHDTVEKVQSQYGPMVLPYVRYSGVAAGQYSRRCPTPISDGKSYPSQDYARVADALGFPDLIP